MTHPNGKKVIGFIELPDEALDLFGHYAQQSDWEVGLVIGVDAESYAARMAHILKVPLLDRPNRLALVECSRVIVGKKPGILATVKELVEGAPVDVVPVDEALRELRELKVRPVRAEPTPARAQTKAAKPSAARSAPRPAGAGPKPASPPVANRPKPGVRTPKRGESHPVPGSAPGTSSRTVFDAGTLLGADFRSKLQALPIDDGDRLLREILELAVKVTGADSGSIMLVDESGSHLRIAVADGLPEWVIAHTRQEVGKGIAGTVFASGEPRLVHGQVSAPKVTSPDVRPGLREAACVPIPGKDGSLGVLNLNVESEATRFDTNTLALLKQFAREASTAILRALNLRRLTGTMQREVAMRQIERLMSLQETVASRLRAVTDVLGQNLGVDYAHCLVADPGGTHLELNGSAKGIGLLAPRKQPIDRGFTGWVLGQGSPCVLEAGTNGDRTALAYLPLRGRRPYGVLVFERMPLDQTTSVQILQFLTEAKEIVEALLALEEATEDLDADFPPGRASA